MITTRDFFLDTIDVRIPAFAEAREVYLSGDLPRAEKLFADYVRTHLDADKYYAIRSVAKNGFGDPESAKAGAERIAEFRLGACGFPYQYPAWNVDWAYNPTPNHYGEYVWQFNRFEMMGTLTRAYHYEKNPLYAKLFAYFMESWIEQNPYPAVQIEQHAGSYDLVGWRTIESGSRMSGSWPFSLHTFIGAPEVSDHLICEIFKSVWEHAFHLMHYYSSHNWLIIEMTGLFVAATVFPFFRQSKQWQDFAFRMMMQELDTQIYPEGMQYELTTGYHLGVAGEYLKVVDFARAYGVEVPAYMMSRIHDMYCATLKMIQPDTRIPDLSDGTSSSAVGYFKLALEYFPDDEQFRYFVSDYKEGKEPPFKSVSMETVGIGVMRTGWEPDAMWALLESAHYGWGHQHEDKLSFDLYAYGKRMLEDGGQYEYDSSAMRSMITSTRAHNTVMVDTYGQNRAATYSRRDQERYVREKIPSDLYWNYAGDEFEAMEGSYKFGYGSKDSLVMVDHHRKVIWFKKGLPGTLPFFVLIDRLTPKDGERHLYEVLFQLGTQPITVQGHTVTADHGDGVTMSLISSAYPDILIGQYKPRYMGWRKDRSTPGVTKEHFPAPAVLFTEKNADAHIVTAVYPNKESSLPIARVTASAPGERESFTVTLTDGKEYTFFEDDARFVTYNRDGEICPEI